LSESEVIAKAPHEKLIGCRHHNDRQFFFNNCNPIFPDKEMRTEGEKVVPWLVKVKQIHNSIN
jgi:hypothetical protein